MSTVTPPAKPPRFRLNPQTARRLKRFRNLKRGYYSFCLLFFLVVMAALGPLLVGNRALAVKYNGRLHFPVLTGFIPGSTFGLGTSYETDYRNLKRVFQERGGDDWVLMPLVPFNGTEVVDVIQPLPFQDGQYRDPQRGGEPIRDAKGLILRADGSIRRVFTVVNGQLHGPMWGNNELDRVVERGTFENGKLVKYTPIDPDLPAEFEEPGLTKLYYQLPNPAPPGVAGHVLGTDEYGRSVAARCFYGFRVLILAAVIYLVMVYSIGISVGCVMGYFGGTFDILVQRFIEVWSCVPFLYVVIILSSLFVPNLFLLMGIIVIFSWMGMTYYMRTATYREKARDYVAAARLIGATPGRIIFRHILPNSLSMIVTFIPFSVASVVGSLTSLDFLGFGLPPSYPSWGEMLKQGTENHETLWILGTVFTSLCTVLILVTFIGEAIREAFDPKKFVVYK